MRWIVPFLITALVTGCVTPLNAADEETPSSTSRPETAPIVHADVSHDYSKEDPRTEAFEVPEDARPVNLRAFFEPTDLAGLDGMRQCEGPARIMVVTPGGDTVVDQRVESSGVQLAFPPPENCGSAVHWERVLLAPGTWTVTFEGDGAAVGRLVIKPR